MVRWLGENREQRKKGKKKSRKYFFRTLVGQAICLSIKRREFEFEVRKAIIFLKLFILAFVALILNFFTDLQKSVFEHPINLLRRFLSDIRWW